MPESVMIVEDEGLVALELEESLRQMGYNVSAVAATGAEAIARATALRPNLVLMDIRLKGEMDGIEAARRIMDTLMIPVVYLTAHSDDATVRRAKETAPFGYVLKPWEEKSLQIAVDMALQKARSEAHVRSERDWYLSILRYSGAPMLVCGADATVRFLNAAAEQLLGAAARGAVGRPLEQIVELREQPGGSSRTAALVKDVAGPTTDSPRSLFLLSGDANLPVDVTTTQITDESGRDVGFLVVMRPVVADEAPLRSRGRRAEPLTLDEYVQTELVRLLILREQKGQPADRFVDGQLEAYRRLMRDHLGRDLAPGQTDWRQGLIRRAVHEAHEQTRSVLLERPDIVEAGRLPFAKLGRYLEVLCDRLVSSSGARPQRPSTRVDVRVVDLDLDSAVYCVLLVDEIVQAALSTGEPQSVAVLLEAAEPGFASLVVKVDGAPPDVAPPVTPVLAALASELNASLAVTPGPQQTWTITFPLRSEAHPPV